LFTFPFFIFVSNFSSFFISLCFRFSFCFGSVCVWFCWYVWVLVFFSYLEFGSLKLICFLKEVRNGFKIFWSWICDWWIF
jgi:hypothetical protein